jgi:hypothetical protein
MLDVTPQDLAGLVQLVTRLNALTVQNGVLTGIS